MAIGFILTVVLIIIIFLMIFWLLYVYPKKYKANVNKALNSGVPIRTIEPTVLFGGISLITLIVLSIVLLVSMNNMKESITQLQSELAQTNWKLNSLQTYVINTNSTMNEMNQDAKWVKSSNYTIESFGEDSLVDITVVIYMNRIPSNGTITLVYSDEDNIVLTQVVTSLTTIFSTEISIDSEIRYDLSVMIDDGITIENEDLFILDVGSKIKGLKSLYLDFIDGQPNEGMIFIVKNNYSLHPDLKFEQVVLTFYLDDLAVFTKIITESTFDVNDAQSYEIKFNPYSYGAGDFLISIEGTDKLGNTYELFGEEWNIELEEYMYYRGLDD